MPWAASVIAWGLGVAGQTPAPATDPVAVAPLELAPAEDAPLPVDLTWSAPSVCPSAEAFLEGIGSLVGRRLAIDRDAALRIDASVRTTRRGFAMALRVEHGEQVEERQLEAPECGVVVQGGSIVVATRLIDVEEEDALAEVHANDRDAQITVPPGPPAPAIATTPALEGRPPSAPPPHAPVPALELELEPDARSRPSVVLGALAGVGVLFDPTATADVRIVAGAEGRRFRFEAHLDHAFARTFTGQHDVRLRVGYTRVSALGCVTLHPARRVVVPLCSGASAGIAAGRGRTPELRTQPAVLRPWFGVPLEVAVAWTFVPGFALRVSVGGTFTVIRSGFHVSTPRGPTTAYLYPWGSVTALAGFEWKSP